ncbi:uncharacterized protein M6B38_419190 [Iris pallida]|uniref:ZCF37 n=1 Tax=Iris pallida TaxID=29817 RepID=A0AAX6FHZ7_IRIPA|nr:uncharacterized protein M6B38_419190 [Iris pallida]
MVVMFCGTRSFSRVDADDDGSWASSRRRPKPSSKLKLKKKTKKSLSALGGRSGKNRSNPYSASGLDKFAKLLAELEAEKREILRKKGSAGEDTVRFRYGSAEERIPIVIKRPQSPPAKKKNATKILLKKEKEDVDDAAEAERAQAPVVTNGGTRKVFSKGWCWNWSGVVPWWAVVVAVVLLCMMFGRAFAVSWAAILWYMVPMMKCDRRKEYGKSWLGRVFFRVTGGRMSTSMIKVEKKMGDGTSVAQELQASPG